MNDVTKGLLEALRFLLSAHGEQLDLAFAQAHDAIARAESAQNLPQVDLEAIARAIWNVRREEEDRCDMELEDMGADHSVWEEASEVASILKDSGIEVVE